MKKLDLGDEVSACFPSDAARELLWFRRSCPADLMGEPGPDAAQLEEILTIAARVPDHRRVTPFRFVIFEGEARQRFGAVLRTRFETLNPDAASSRADFEANRFNRAPVVIAVIYAPNREHKTPVWEQELAVGAVCQNMLLAASANGFAAQWITEWYAYDSEIERAIGLSDGERIAGFIYIGTATESPKERARPDLALITARF